MESTERTTRSVEMMSKIIAENNVEFYKTFEEIKQPRQDQGM
jgi:hypothetical protein